MADDRAPETALVVMNRADDEAGGSLRAAINTADALAATGVAVTFTAPIHRSVESLRAVSSMHSNVKVVLFRTSRVFARFGGSPAHMWWIVRNIRRFDYVHIHTIFHLGSLYTSFVCAFARVPYFIWPHGCLDEYDLRKHARMKSITGRTVFALYLRRASAFLCTTAREARDLVTFGGSAPREVVRLPVDDLPPYNSTGRAWRARHGIDPDTFLILFLGRIDPKKGLERLVDALALMRDADVTLAIVGAGADDAGMLAIKARAAAAGVADKIVFVSWLEGAERTGAYVASDVFALPSDNENFGIAVVEALLMDVPVIVSDQVYISDDLRDAGAAIIAQRAAADVADAVLAVRNDPVEAAAMAKRGHALAADLYSADAVAQRLRSVAIRWRLATR